MAKKQSKRQAKKQAKKQQQQNLKNQPSYKLPTNKLRMQKSMIKKAIDYATKHSQSLEPVDTEQIILDHAEKMVETAIPQYMEDFFDIYELLQSEPDSPVSKTGKEEWNYFWKDKKLRDTHVLLNIFNSAIDQDGGAMVTAKKLEGRAKELIDLIDKITHESGGKGGIELQEDFETFINIVLGRTMSAKQAKVIQSRLERYEKQSIVDYLTDNYNVNPITGKGIKKQKDIVIPFRNFEKGRRKR